MSYFCNTIYPCQRDLTGSGHPPCDCDVCEVYYDAPFGFEHESGSDPYQSRNTYDPHQIEQWIDDLGSRELTLAARERAANIREIALEIREAAVMKFYAVGGCGRGAVGSSSTGVRQPGLKNKIAVFEDMIENSKPSR